MDRPTAHRFGKNVAVAAIMLASCSTANDMAPQPSSSSGTSPTVTSAPTTTTTSTSSTTESPKSPALQPGWREITDLPFGLMDPGVIVAADSGIVVARSDSTEIVGYDGSWNRAAAPPFSVRSGWCGGISGLPAGGSVVYIDETGSETWVFDVDATVWREAGQRPAAGFALGSTVIGRELFVVTAADRTDAGKSSLMVLNLDTGLWTELEEVPAPISVGGLTHEDERLIIAGTKQGPNNNVIGDREPVAFEYTRSTGWIQLPSVPIDGQATSVAWVAGAGLLAWNYSQESALLDGSGTWQYLGEVPMPFSECYPRSAVTLVGAVAICGGVALFDNITGGWVPVPVSFDTRVFVTDTALFGLVEVSSEQTQLVEYLIQERED